mmetsp:Transcript_78442/g.109031  ORF Transcript_78442/g.109031 Transcript_78442/m.109031 type:complete len:219 (+) Transcript_78442:228-884(+)
MKTVHVRTHLHLHLYLFLQIGVAIGDRWLEGRFDANDPSEFYLQANDLFSSMNIHSNSARQRLSPAMALAHHVERSAASGDEEQLSAQTAAVSNSCLLDCDNVVGLLQVESNFFCFTAVGAIATWLLWTRVSNQSSSLIHLLRAISEKELYHLNFELAHKCPNPCQHRALGGSDEGGFLWHLRLTQSAPNLLAQAARKFGLDLINRATSFTCLKDCLI